MSGHLRQEELTRVLLQEAWQQHRWAQQCQQRLWELCIQLDFLELSEAARLDRLERLEVCSKECQWVRMPILLKEDLW